MIHVCLIFLLVSFSIKSMNNEDVLMEKAYEIQDAPVPTEEQKAFWNYMKILESVPLQDFTKTIEAGLYKDQLPNIINYAIKTRSLKIIERIMCHYPESITEQTIQFAKDRINEEQKWLCDKEKRINFYKENKEQAIELMIRANSRFNFSHERALRIIEGEIFNSNQMKDLEFRGFINQFNLCSAIMKQHSFIQTQSKALHDIIFDTPKSYLTILPKELKQELYKFAHKRWLDELCENGLRGLSEVEKKREEEYEKLKKENTQQTSIVWDKCWIM